MEHPKEKRYTWRNTKYAIYTHLIQPFTETYEPVPQVSWGATLGMLVGLLPLMGIQMYVIASIWVVARYIFRFRFNLAIGIAMVWITNPVTVLPIYFVYLETGILLLHGAGRVTEPIDFGLFQDRFSHIQYQYAGDWLQQALEGALLVFWEFGWPIVIGSLMWAIPFTLLTFPTVSFALTRYRRYLAREKGLSYEEWKVRYIVAE